MNSWARPSYIVIFLATSVNFCFAFNQEIEEIPFIIEPIRNVSVMAGDTATFDCIIDNFGKSQVRWMHKDRGMDISIDTNVITEIPRFFVSRSPDLRKWTLTIENVDDSDRGGYECRVSSAYFPTIIMSEAGYLQVWDLPQIADSSDVVSIKEGENTTLDCRAEGYPRPYVLWKRLDGRSLPVSLWRINKEKKVTYLGERLPVTTAHRSHNGPYECMVWSEKFPAAVKKVVNLEVRFGPTASVPLQHVGVNIGNDVMLECHVEAYPIYATSWKKDGSGVVESGGRFSVKLTSTEVMYKQRIRLYIKNTTHEDLGVYTCVGANSLGVDEKHVELYENLDSRDLKLIPPIISDFTQDVIITEGHDVTLVCHAYGRPHPSVLWRRLDGKAIAGEEHGGPKHRWEMNATEGELVIRNLSREDTGTFQCIASNEMCPPVARMISLAVYFAPTVTAAIKRLGTIAGSEAMMMVNIQAFPVKYAEWKREDGSAVESTDKYKTKLKLECEPYKLKMTLTFKCVSYFDFGKYMAVIHTSMGTVEEEIELYDATPELFPKTGSGARRSVCSGLLLIFCYVWWRIVQGNKH